MKNIIIKAAGFLCIFFSALILFSHFMNKGNTDLTVEMDQASFPVIYMQVEGVKVNCLHGYEGVMKANYLRDTLTPLSSDRSLPIEIDTFGAKVKTIAYEVRSLNTERLVENTPVYNYIEKDSTISATLNIKDLIDMDTEYILVLVIGTEDGKELRYYTRIIYQDEKKGLHATENLTFVQNFHNKTFDKEQAKELVTYLESNEEGDNSSYHYVNIHSSFNQITWGSLKVEQVGNPFINILEMDTSTAVVQLKYQVKIPGKNGGEYFNVTELYRMRYTAERIYLLDYERTMDQIFDSEQPVFMNNKIMLGITGTDIAYQENTGGTAIAFVQENALYSFRNSESKLIRLFSFRDKDNNDIRTNYDNHGIKILSVDEGGNVRFLVYGYMNRGRHEGNTGVSVYFYDRNVNSIEEEVYIPYEKSYELLKQNVESLSYINSKNILYMLIDDTVYEVRLEDQSYTVMVSGLTEGSYVVSKSNTMIAWQKNLENRSENTEVIFMDLSSGARRSILSEGNDVITPLGFMDEDLVFGLSDKNDITKDALGITVTPMHTICIEDKMGNEKKKYQKQGMYITHVTMEDGVLRMKRITKLADTAGYVTADDDQIMNNQVKAASKNTITSAVTEDREKIVEIELISEINSKAVKLLTPKEVLFEGGRNLALKAEEKNTEHFYVYAKGSLAGVFEDANRAVNLASDVAGVVVNDGQEYIWQKGNRKLRNQMEDMEEVKADDKTSGLAVCLNAMLLHEGISRNSQDLLLQGGTAISILGDNLSAQILDLSGCSLESVLYYVSRGIPVLVTVENERNVLIVGYDEKNTILLDPETGTIARHGMNDSKEWFERNGNEFITYVKKAD